MFMMSDAQSLCGYRIVDTFNCTPASSIGLLRKANLNLRSQYDMVLYGKLWCLEMFSKKDPGTSTALLGVFRLSSERHQNALQMAFTSLKL